MARRQIMIVGNGDVPDGAAGLIDAADLVIRFNDCRSVGAGGSRTDIVAVCNTGRPGKGMLSSALWTMNPAVIAARAIWCVRDPQKFRDMRAPLAVSHPELDDFCDDYTEGFAAFAAETGKDHFTIGRDVHEALDVALSAYDPAPYVVPSSGLVAIAHVLAAEEFRDGDICLAGFGHQGWEWHPFAAERRFVDDHVARGRLSRIDTLLATTERPLLHCTSEVTR